MSEKKARPDWKKFEELVAMVESHLAPRGAIVRSPDKIHDCNGNPRNVDASIRYKVGSIPILITIECRDRSRKSDVQWIEQLITKRNIIKASATLAVSSKGFSKQAAELAKKYNIETRIFKDVSEQAIKDWAKNIKIFTAKCEFEMVCLRIKLKPTSDNIKQVLHSRINQECAKGDVEYKFIRRIVDGKLISIGDLMRDEDRKAGKPIYDQLKREVVVTLPPKTTVSITTSSSFPSLCENVQVGGPPVKKIGTFYFGPNEATVETELGHVEVESLVVEFLVRIQAYPSKIGRLLSYENSEKQITLVEDREVQLFDGKSIRVVIT